LRYDKVSVDVSICFRYFEENVFFFFFNSKAEIDMDKSKARFICCCTVITL